MVVKTSMVLAHTETRLPRSVQTGTHETPIPEASTSTFRRIHAQAQVRVVAPAIWQPRLDRILPTGIPVRERGIG